MEDYKKKYEEALENLKRIRNANRNNKELVDFIEFKYPEIKESEDGRMIKSLKRLIKAYYDVNFPTTEGFEREDMLAWLEKQSEKVNVIENFNTEFEKQISHLIASTINKEYEYNEGFVKWAANALLNYAKHELEKQGENQYIIKPKFNIGDKVILKHSKSVVTITRISDSGKSYWTEGQGCGSGWWLEQDLEQYNKE